MQLALRHLTGRTGDGHSEAEGGQPFSSKPEMPVTVPAAESATVAASSEHKLGHLHCTDWQLEMSFSCCDHCQSHSGVFIPISQDEDEQGLAGLPVCTRNVAGRVGPNLHQLTVLTMSSCTIAAEARLAECPAALQLLLLLIAVHALKRGVRSKQLYRDNFIVHRYHRTISALFEQHVDASLAHPQIDAQFKP